MEDKSELLEMTADIVSAYVGNNSVSADALPGLIANIHAKSNAQPPYKYSCSLFRIGDDGLTREVASEIAFLAGVKPLTGAKIMGDVGGEPLAILCKATGMGRGDLLALWRSMRRPETAADGSPHPDWERVQITYEMLAVDRAQTVLRYWNWSLSSALTPALMKAIRDGEDETADDYSAPERAAMMALAQDFGR